MQYICKECNLEFKSLWGLSSHNVQKHKTKPEDLYIEYELNGQKPTCACGCKMTPNFLGIKKGFTKYVKGHHQRVHNNWGHNPKIVKKSHDTQRKLFKEGKLQSWNKGLTKEVDERLGYGQKISDNKERSEKISKALKGRKRPKEVLDKLNKGMLEYWSKSENRDAKRLSQVKYLQEKQINQKSKLEQKFEDMLVELKIQFINQHPLNGYLYDFYLPKHNLLIEVDGDWFHCNPDVYPEAIHEIQKFVIENDERKNLVAKENNIPLLRFWEKDINENFDMVKSELSRYL